MSFVENIEELVERSTNSLHGSHPTWERVKIGEIADLVNGFAFKSSGFHEINGMPIVRIRDVTSGRAGTFYANPVNDPKMTFIDNGQIAIGMDGDFNCRIWAGGKSLLNQRVCTLQTDDELYSQKFLAFLLPGYLKLINDHTSSVTVKHLSSVTVRDIPVPLPPLNEQRRIVDKIEMLFTQLDKGEEALRNAQRLLARYRQSVLKAAVTGQLTADWRAERLRNSEADGAELLARVLEARRAGWEGRGRYKVPATPHTSDLAELPRGWVWSTVDQILRAGLSNGRSVPDADEGFAVLRLTALRGGRVDISQRKTGAWDATAAAPFLIAEGDILVSRGNGSKRLVGLGGLVDLQPDAVAYPDTMIRLPIQLEHLVPAWFLQLWNSPFMRSQIEKAAKTTAGIYKINQNNIENFVVPLPPKEEQFEISALVDEHMVKISQLEVWCTAETTRISALRRSILKDAFAGRLVAQDPADEPASELLRRIRGA